MALWLGLLTSPFDSALAQPPLLEVVHSRCAVLQDVIDDLAAHYADPDRLARADKDIPHSILDRIVAAGIEQIDRLFQCFGFRENTEFFERSLQMSIPVAIANVPMTAEKKEYGQLGVEAWILVTRKADGRLVAEGKYRAE